MAQLSEETRLPKEGMAKWFRKELVLVLMLITAFVCLRFPLPFMTTPPIKFVASAAANASDGYFTIDGQEIYCKQAQPTEQAVGVTVVLLHGAAFTSQNWEDIRTLNHLAKEGITAFALDLPGHGKSKEAKVSNRAEFLKLVMDFVQGSTKIVVSPSMSGSYAIPYVNEYGDELDGYVPVAPAAIQLLAPPESVLKTLPVFAVVGENDRNGLATTAILKEKFENFKQLVIPHGSHPAYLDDPQLFNSELAKFALSLA